jgi:hypothetical protein
LLDDLVGAEVTGELLPVRMARHRHDASGSDSLGGEHCAQANCAVTDDSNRASGRDTSGDGGVVARGEDIGQRQQVSHQLLARLLRGRHERAVGERSTYDLALTAVDGMALVVLTAPVAALDARRVDAAKTESTRVVGERERCDDEVADIQRRDRRADLFDDAHELVTDTPRRLELIDAAIGPQVGSAHAGRDDAHDRIIVLDQLRIGHVVEADVVWGMKDGGTHVASLAAEAI